MNGLNIVYQCYKPTKWSTLRALEHFSLVAFGLGDVLSPVASRRNGGSNLQVIDGGREEENRPVPVQIDQERPLKSTDGKTHVLPHLVSIFFLQNKTKGA